MFVQRGDQPVGQLAQQAGGLQPGDLVLLEGVLHMLLDAREMTAERAKRGVARIRLPPRLSAASAAESAATPRLQGRLARGYGASIHVTSDAAVSETRQ